MAGPPTHTPLADFGRAVQAYSYSRLSGGSLEQAEAAAQHAWPALGDADLTDLTVVDVAKASAGARQAAQALAGGDAASARAYGLGAGKATPEGATVRTITAIVYYVTRDGTKLS